jgi:hypothetical protein
LGKTARRIGDGMKPIKDVKKIKPKKEKFRFDTHVLEDDDNSYDYQLSHNDDLNAN